MKSIDATRIGFEDILLKHDKSIIKHKLRMNCG